MLSAIAQLIPHLAVYSILLFIGIKIIDKQFIVGDFTFFNGIIVQFVGGVTALFGSINKSYESEQKLANFSNFLNLHSNMDTNGEHIIEKIESIEFRNVSFKYPNTTKNALTNVSFILQAGKITALVGENGAGKTTIVKLILRLYNPTEGEILINGINIKSIDLKSLHSVIGVVFQDFNTYELTLREVVAISDIERKAHDDQIIDACMKANFSLQQEYFINGIDTYIGKTFDINGVILSGGQKQKLAIAESYFKNCSYYIMDEPNSALDPIAEGELLLKLEELSQDHGALFITHKLSVMLVTDEIIVFKNGKIIEMGTHNELIAKNGEYKKLYSTQAENYKY